MATIVGFPMVSQLTTVTGDGMPSENAAQDCVAASVDALCRWLLSQPENSVFNPDHFKDAADGANYVGGTSATDYIEFCKSIGIHLYSIDTPQDAAQAVATAHQLIGQGKAVMFTELDPYVDTSLPQYANWTHVCVWFSEDTGGLTAMDPYIGRPVYKTDATWTNVLRSNQLWTAERINTVTIPQGWVDDGQTLRSPNNIPIVRGFRDYVLSHNWNPDNWPLEAEQGMSRLEASNASLGGGTQQIFRWSMLGWTTARGVFEEWTGQELLYTRQQYTQIYAAYQQLKAQVQQNQPAQPPAPDPMVQKLTDRIQAIALQAHIVETDAAKVQQLATSPIV